MEYEELHYAALLTRYPYFSEPNPETADAWEIQTYKSRRMPLLLSSRFA
jgi:hypothetical protein